MDLFDDDDTLEYEPETTAALIMTGGDEEEEAEALEVDFASHMQLAGHARKSSQIFSSHFESHVAVGHSDLHRKI